jgi:hypothetical protein
LPDLGIELLDRPLRPPLSVEVCTRVERPRRLFDQLLLPRVDLIGMDLVPLPKSAIVDCSRSASRAIFAFRAASIFRLVFFIILLRLP